MEKSFVVFYMQQTQKICYRWE